MTDADLLPCPFCGGAAQFSSWIDVQAGVYLWAKCKQCGAGTEARLGESIDQLEPIAASEWNKRDWSAAMAIVHSVQSAEFTPTTMTTTNFQNISSSVVNGSDLHL